MISYQQLQQQKSRKSFLRPSLVKTNHVKKWVKIGLKYMKVHFYAETRQNFINLQKVHFSSLVFIFHKKKSLKII